MAEVFKKEDLQKLSFQKISYWLELNREQLIGSAIFTKQDTLTSKLVRWGERHLFAKCNSNDCFVPSHTGSIIEYDNDLYIFDMKPPRASVQSLIKYLLETDEDYVLVMRDFKLNTEMFSKNLAYHIGEFYAYLSALRSVFTKRQTKWVRHCSEMHLRELQIQGLFTDINPEITPDELLHVLGGANE